MEGYLAAVWAGASRVGSGLEGEFAGSGGLVRRGVGPGGCGGLTRGRAAERRVGGGGHVGG